MPTTADRTSAFDPNFGVAFGARPHQASSLTCYKGSFLGRDSNGYAVLWSDTDGEVPLGIAMENVTSGSSVIIRSVDGDVIRGEDGDTSGPNAGLTIAGCTAQSDVGARVWLADDNLETGLTLTEGSGPHIGIVEKYVSSGKGWLRLDLPAALVATTLELEGDLETDTINEFTAAAGVTVDGVLLKDTTVDVNGTADALILDADGDTTISAPTDDQIDVEIGGTDLTVMTGGTHARTRFDVPNHLEPGHAVLMGSDFMMKAFDETNEQWILNSGSDDLAVDPAIVVAENGTAFLDAGDGDGTIAVDGSQLVWAIPVQADSGGLTVYARAKIEDITGCSVNIGLTDVTTLEEPFSIGGGDTVTSAATNAVAAVFDDGADTKEWFFLGVDGDTDATGNGATGTAPVNDTYQTFRIEVDSDGEGARLYIDDTLAGTLTAAACAASTNLYLTAVICGDGGNGAAVGLTLDYLYVKHDR